MKIYTLAAALCLSVLCFGQAGTLNTQFNGGFVTTTFNSWNCGANDIAVQPDGKLVVAGYSNIGAVSHFALARYNPNGTLDASFGLGGKVLMNLNLLGSWIEAVAVKPDGKIIAGGGIATSTGSNFAMMQFTSNGAPDPLFGTNGLVTTSFGSSALIKSIAIQPNGKIIAAGNVTVNVISSDYAVARYNADGTLDNNFNGTGIVTGDIEGEDFIESVKLIGGGNIIIGGTCGFLFTTPPSGSKFCLARFSSTGTLDHSFGNEGIVITDVSVNDDICAGMALQQNGKIIAAGGGEFPPSNYNMTLVRYDQQGNVDNSFGTNGIASIDYQGNQEQAKCLFIQNDNKIVVAGTTSINNGPTSFIIARFDANGSIDNTFGTNGLTVTTIGTNDNVNGIVSKGNIVYLAGIKAGTPDAFLVTSYVNDATPLPVRFSSFTVEKQNTMTLLKWQTEFEENTKSFIAEKSHDGSTFSTLAEIAATASSTTNRDYRTTDEKPFPDITYYRIRSVDINGSFSFTKILYVKNEIKEIQITPNPATSSAQIQFPGGIKDKVRIDLLDMNGRLAKSSVTQLNGNALSFTLNISDLTAGSYILKITGSNLALSQQLIKN